MLKSIMLFGLIFLGMGLKAQFVNNLNIKGTITNAESQWVYLSELVGGQMSMIDSAKIGTNNSFSISTNISKANFFQLSNNGKQYTLLILEPNESLEIDINAQSMLQPNRINGSENTMQLYSILQQINRYDAYQKQLEARYKTFEGTAEQDSMGQVLAAEYEMVNKQKEEYIKQEINKSPSLATVLFIEKIDINDNFDLYFKLDSALYEKYADNAFINELHKKVEGKMLLMPGRVVPEINLPSPEGENIALSSLKGKVVLIDFWASWCRPCRGENPNTVKLYSKYKDQGFEIYAVSLDKERASWLKAIEDDHLGWIHVSDLGYWNSVAARAYGVGSIPFTVLIDKEGKVIATGLRGEALAHKLAQLFGE